MIIYDDDGIIIRDVKLLWNFLDFKQLYKNISSTRNYYYTTSPQVSKNPRDSCSLRNHRRKSKHIWSNEMQSSSPTQISERKQWFSLVFDLHIFDLASRKIIRRSDSQRESDQFTHYTLLHKITNSSATSIWKKTTMCKKNVMR